MEIDSHTFSRCRTTCHRCVLASSASVLLRVGRLPGGQNCSQEGDARSSTAAGKGLHLCPGFEKTGLVLPPWGFWSLPDTPVPCCAPVWLKALWRPLPAPVNHVVGLCVPLFTPIASAAARRRRRHLAIITGMRNSLQSRCGASACLPLSSSEHGCSKLTLKLLHAAIRCVLASSAWVPRLLPVGCLPAGGAQHGKGNARSSATGKGPLTSSPQSLPGVRKNRVALSALGILVVTGYPRPWALCSPTPPRTHLQLRLRQPCRWPVCPPYPSAASTSWR